MQTHIHTVIKLMHSLAIENIYPVIRSNTVTKSDAVNHETGKT